jgi:hypothetical protein
MKLKKLNNKGLMYLWIVTGLMIFTVILVWVGMKDVINVTIPTAMAQQGMTSATDSDTWKFIKGVFNIFPVLLIAGTLLYAIVKGQNPYGQ